MNTLRSWSVGPAGSGEGAGPTTPGMVETGVPVGCPGGVIAAGGDTQPASTRRKIRMTVTIMKPENLIPADGYFRDIKYY
jgi:hypothetical protein